MALTNIGSLEDVGGHLHLTAGIPLGRLPTFTIAERCTRKAAAPTRKAGQGRRFTDLCRSPVINLRAGESFFALCQRTADERQIHLSRAIRMVSAAHPDLAEAYGRGEF